MGFLNQLAQAATAAALSTRSPQSDQGPSTDQGDISSLLTPLLEHCGGVQGLVAQLMKSQLGPALASWLGQGPNEAISGLQLRQALGEQTVELAAAPTGLNVVDWGERLAQVLPALVDQLSPQGHLKEATGLDLQDLGGLIGGLLQSKSGG